MVNRCATVIVLVVGIVIGVTETAHAQDGLKIPTTLFVAGSVLDDVSTYVILSHGGTEQNPFLAPLKTPARIVGVMIASEVGSYLLAKRLQHTKPGAAKALLYIAASVHLSCGLTNIPAWRQSMTPAVGVTLTRTF